MSRRRKASESSLELLLDTICNTFGGVLFVAILIVVMLKMTSRIEASIDADEVSEADMAELTRQQANLAETLQTLQSVAAQLDGQLQGKEKAAELIAELSSAQEARRSLTKARLEVLSKVAEHQASTNKTAAELAKLQSRMEAANQRHQQVAAELKSEVDKRSRRVEFSAKRSTGKQEIQTILRYGRFYIWHRHGPDGERLGLNTDEFVVLSEDRRAAHTTPIPGAGTPVVGSDESDRQLKGRLQTFSPSRDYIAIVVWPDSYGDFASLKKALVESGFEYRLIPATDDSSFTDRGGSGGGVQ